MLESGVCRLLNCPQKCWGSLGSPPAGVLGSLPPEWRKGELSPSLSNKIAFHYSLLVLKK